MTWCGLLAASVACRSGPDVVVDSTSRRAFERSLHALTEADEGPKGLTVLVGRSDRLIYSHAVGTTGDAVGTPASREASHQWWSVTKVATAMAVLQLHDAGRLKLDDPVAAYLPSFAVESVRNGDPPVTIRHLLNHTSGLGDIGWQIIGWIHFEGDARRDQQALMRQALTERSRLDTAPGERGRYSNLGYLTLAALVEKVSGERFEDYIRTNILKPLQMHRTDFVYTDAVAQVEAIGSHPRDLMGWLAFTFYIDRAKAVARSDESRHYFNRLYSDQLGATGLIGPATDMLRLGRCLVRGGELDGARVISEGSAALMQAPTLLSGRRSATSGRALKFGAPWFIDEGAERGPTLSHAGAGMGYVSFLQVRPRDRIVVVVMGNGTYLDGAWGERVAEAAVEVAVQASKSTE